VKPFAETQDDSDKENEDPDSCSEDDERYPLTQPKVQLEDRVIADLVMEYNVHEDFRALLGLTRWSLSSSLRLRTLRRLRWRTSKHSLTLHRWKMTT